LVEIWSAKTHRVVPVGMGRWDSHPEVWSGVVLSYPKISPMLLFTLMTPYDYPMGKGQPKHPNETNGEMSNAKTVLTMKRSEIELKNVFPKTLIYMYKWASVLIQN
jgi:hypothetical protein